MNMRFLKFTIIAVMLCSSCSLYENQNNCDDIEIKETYVPSSGGSFNSGIPEISYNHLIILKEYEEKCFDKYNFIFTADKYLDTVTHDTPISSIHFCKPFNYDPSSFSVNEEIKKNSIVEIWYNEDDTSKTKMKEINSVLFWKDGRSYPLDEIDQARRIDRINYLHKKALNQE